MNFKRYIVNPQYNELFVTFSNCILKREREDLEEYLLTEMCHKDESDNKDERHGWGKNVFNESEVYYTLRLRTDVLNGACYFYEKLINDYFCNLKRICKFTIIDAQTLIAGVGGNTSPP